MTSRDNIEFIVFAIEQARQAETFGFSRNECCRNLKTALHQYWQSKELQQHSTAHKGRIPRSRAAMTAELEECEVEHAVPQMYIVNLLMDMPSPTSDKVRELLKRLFVVRLVTRQEHAALNSSGLRSRMPDDWDTLDVFARYRKVGIEIPED